jgi:hypothetical protein
MSAREWTVAEAKAKFSELIEEARIRGRRPLLGMAASRL